MNRTAGSASLRTALAIAALALALSGCGRKAGLDLPPSAAARGAVPAQQTTAPAADPNPNPLGWFDPSVNDPPPAAAKGNKKRIILDPLLD